MQYAGLASGVKGRRNIYQNKRFLLLFDRISRGRKVTASFISSEIIPVLNQGFVKSLYVIVPAAFFGLAFGIVLGTARAYGGPVLSGLAKGYVALFRGTPLVIQLMILYFGLPNIGIYLSPYTAATLGFILCSAAYHCEYVRGGLVSIKKGQFLAAQALGLSTVQALSAIIIPQAFRKALPGCGNEIIYLIKYSSLAYIVTFIELTAEAKNLASRTFHFTEVFTIVGLYYLFLVTLATWLLHLLDKKLALPGFGQSSSQ